MSEKQKSDEFFEDMTPRVTGHILIRDPESGEVFVNQRDGRYLGTNREQGEDREDV